MDYVKGKINFKQQFYRIKFKNGEYRTFTKDLHQILISKDENIFYDQEDVVIIRKNDFKNILNLMNEYENLKTENFDLKSIISQLEDKIITLEEYNQYLKLENKISTKKNNNNFYTQ